MKALFLALTAAGGLLAAGANQAQAQWGSGGYGCSAGLGYGGYGYGTGYGGIYGGYVQPYYGHIHHGVNPYTATWGGGHLHWHDTSHYDYVPSRIIPHGNHYHVQPGGYIWHQQGHFDLHH